MTNDAAIRDHVARILAWEDAHVGFDNAIARIPVKIRGRRPSGLHSPWELLDHLRIAQHDILDFCRNPRYREMRWPDDYWPPSPSPPSAAAWYASIKQFRKDRKALQRLAANPKIDLTARIPHGTGQTYLRELLLTADHTAYHVGQIVLVRQLLGAWQPK